MELVRKIYSTLAGTRRDIEVTKGKIEKLCIDLNLNIFTFLYLGHEFDLNLPSEARSRKFVVIVYTLHLGHSGLQKSRWICWDAEVRNGKVALTGLKRTLA